MVRAVHPGEAAVTFQLLGPLEVHVPGAHVPIASSRQRIVLGLLLMSRSQVVTVDMLIDAVWDGEPPSSARGQIQICISALRRAIGIPGLIETKPDGYCIQGREGELDCDVFDAELAIARAATAEGDLRTALEHFDVALGLWRGPALAGVPGRAIQALANRLEERRLLAIEDRIEALLGLGAHRDLTDELVTLTSQYPLRERLWGFRMIALYRSERQAEALAAYQEARQALIDELGLEPGEYLSELERAVLSHDSSLDPASGGEPTRLSKPPRQLPTDTPHFAGHAAEVEELRAALTGSGDPAEYGAARVAVITGPAGCGKTTVALHVAHLLRDQFPDGQFFANLHGSSANPTQVSEAMASFLRALGVPADVVPADEEERSSLLRSHLADRRLLIVLDNVADEQQVIDLLPGVPGPAVLATGRCRFAALGGAHVAELGTLSEADSVELLECTVGKGRLSAADATELARMCGGLPLALHIAGARLAAHPYWSVSTLLERLVDESHRLDELSHGDVGVRPLLALVYGSLSESAQELLCLLSMLEFPDFSPLVAASMLDRDLTDVMPMLDELSDAWLLQVTSVDDQTIRYSFPELTRIFVREQSSGQFEEECGPAIERVFGCLLAVARDAHRRVYGGDFTLLRGSSPIWLGAKPHLDWMLRDPMAWFDAARPCLRAAVQQAARLGLDEFCWEIAVVATTFYENRGLFDEWSSTHMTALEAVQSTGNRRGQGALLVSLGSPALGRQSGYDEKMLLDALGLFEEIGDELGQALSLRALAHRDRLHGHPERAVERYEQALQGFQSVGDMAAQTHALSGLARAYLDMRQLDRAEAIAKRSLEVSQRIQSRRLQAQALHRLGEVLLDGTQTLAARAVFQEAMHLAREDNDCIGEIHTLAALGSVELEMGNLGPAEKNLTQALELCKTVRDRNIQAHILFRLGRVCERRNERGRAEQYYVQATNAFAAQKNAPWHSRAMNALRVVREASEALPVLGEE
jgi:DNA-binding SARP family transcriptional activator